ncbi:hypothetical protein LW059_004505 [Salmonella enterica]|uniref:hypothetical protein n=1 Tax=Citrobacter sp. XY323 TaxID=2976537 RepID=UPI00127962DE|nr:hypothetical protein [Citrobacter sp. XY323]EAN4566496.1 hypothetical protein [Salmonella enterica subsp. enterica serovar Senftenberg]EAT0477624.1 hypothetical protein [Salmonella enterica]EBG8282921.1 hypothetical protein [Salmonella enterica subsp. enterica serovar Muenchen]HEO1692183.1 hypothetical protein [Citrobacter freundii]EIL1839696.1 hypothetical protein [Salmonella enterica]
MRISIVQMVNDYYEGNREKAAQAAGINSVQQLNNLVSKGYEVARLDNGDWIMLTSKTKIFKSHK